MPPSVIDLPKRQRSGAYRFSDEDRNATLELLSQAKTGQAVMVTDVFTPDSDSDADKVKARNVASGRNNVIREALEPHIDDNYHVKMHVVETGGGYAGAVSLRAGAKPERKPRKATVRRRKNESQAAYDKRKAAAQNGNNG